MACRHRASAIRGDRILPGGRFPGETRHDMDADISPLGFPGSGQLDPVLEGTARSHTADHIDFRNRQLHVHGRYVSGNGRVVSVRPGRVFRYRHYAIGHAPLETAPLSCSVDSVPLVHRCDTSGQPTVVRHFLSVAHSRVHLAAKMRAPFSISEGNICLRGSVGLLSFHGRAHPSVRRSLASCTATTQLSLSPTASKEVPLRVSDTNCPTFRCVALARGDATRSGNLDKP